MVEYDYQQIPIGVSTTFFEEVDEETYQMLSDYCYKKTQSRKYNETYRYVLVEKVEQPIAQTIAEYKKLILEEQKERERYSQRIIEEKKKRAKAKKDRERKKFEELKKKYGTEK